MDIQEIEARLARFGPLKAGAHPPDGEACIMEAVAFVAGEPWSDHPECVCPVLGAFMRAWNDGLPDDERDTLLRPLIPQLIGTRGSKELSDRRALMAADWLIREHTPAWLRLAKLDKQADALASLPEITAFAQIPSIRAPMRLRPGMRPGLRPGLRPGMRPGLPSRKRASLYSARRSIWSSG